MRGLNGSSQCGGWVGGEHWESLGSGSQAKKGFPEAGTQATNKSTRRRKKHTGRKSAKVDFPIGVKVTLNKSRLKKEQNSDFRIDLNPVSGSRWRQ